jgi:hypothetical protein
VSIGGGQVIERYSQAAIDQLRDSANEVDMDAAWKTYRKRHKIGRQPADVPGQSRTPRCAADGERP